MSLAVLQNDVSSGFWQFYLWGPIRCATDRYNNVITLHRASHVNSHKWYMLKCLCLSLKRQYLWFCCLDFDHLLLSDIIALNSKWSKKQSFYSTNSSSFSKCGAYITHRRWVAWQESIYVLFIYGAIKGFILLFFTYAVTLLKICKNTVHMKIGGITLKHHSIACSRGERHAVIQLHCSVWKVQNRKGGHVVLQRNQK